MGDSYNASPSYYRPEARRVDAESPQPIWDGEKDSVDELMAILRNNIGKKVEVQEGMGTSVILEVCSLEEGANGQVSDYIRIFGEFKVIDRDVVENTKRICMNKNMKIYSIYPTLNLVCTCPMSILNSQGCQCGAFKREMEAKYGKRT
jgi:hypothetical protein